MSMMLNKWGRDFVNMTCINAFHYDSRLSQFLIDNLSERCSLTRATRRVARRAALPASNHTYLEIDGVHQLHVKSSLKRTP